YSNANPNDPFIQTALPATGTYYVEVRELRGFVGNENAFYQLGVDLGPAASNDTLAAASPVSAPRGVGGTLSPSRDSALSALAPAPAPSLSADADARQDLLSLLSGTVTAMTASGTPLGSSSASPDPFLVASVPAGGAAVSISGPSSGLCQDAYYQLW